jgi:hypothetical protein
VKTAMVRLASALLGLVTSLVSLASAMVALAEAGARCLAARMGPRVAPLPTKPRARTGAKVGLTLVGPVQAEDRGEGARKLEGALRGLGFRPSDVEHAVGALRDRAEREPLEGLIVEALGQLTRKAS